MSDRPGRLGAAGQGRQPDHPGQPGRGEEIPDRRLQGDAIAEFLGKNGFEADLALRDQENAQKLVKGQIDLWASGDPAGRYLAKQEGVTGLKTVLRFNSDQLYLALNRETPDEVVQKLQAALDGMRKEGFVEDILNSYL